MRLDSAQDGGPEVIAGALSPAMIARELAADGRITQAERCRIAQAVADRYSFAAPVFEAETGCEL